MPTALRTSAPKFCGSEMPSSTMPTSEGPASSSEKSSCSISGAQATTPWCTVPSVSASSKARGSRVTSATSWSVANRISASSRGLSPCSTLTRVMARPCARMASRTGCSPATKRPVTSGRSSGGRAGRRPKSGRRRNGLAHLAEDVTGGGGRIGGVADRTTDDQQARAVFQRGGGRADALLIAAGGAGGPDAGRDQDHFGTERRAQGRDLGGGANQAVNARAVRQPTEPQGVVGGAVVHASGAQIGGVERGEHGDGQQLQARAFALGARGRGLEHARTARRMQGEKAGAELARGRYRSLHRFGDVVQLQIEEDAIAEARAEPHRGRAFGHEQLEPDFEHAHDIRDARRAGFG